MHVKGRLNEEGPFSLILIGGLKKREKRILKHLGPRI